MISRKRAFEDDTVDGVNPASLAVRKIKKAKALAEKTIEYNPGAEAGTMAPVAIEAHVAQEAPTPPTVSESILESAPAPAPLIISEDKSDDDAEGSDKWCYSPPKNKGKEPSETEKIQAPRVAPDTTADLQKRNLWRMEWEKEMVGKLGSEMMNLACVELETRRELEKKEWEAEAIRKMDEEIEAVSEFFKLQSAEAFGAAQRAKAHADSQAELSNQFQAELQAKQLEVNFLQALLNGNTNSNKGLAQEYQDLEIAFLNQKDLKIQRLEDELTKATSETENSCKSRNDALNEIANHAKKIKSLEERLEVVRGVNRDLHSAGVEKDRKVHQLTKELEEVRNLPASRQEIQNLEERLEVVRKVNRDLHSAGVEKDQTIHQLTKEVEEIRNLPTASQEVQNLEERLEVVRGANRDLQSAGVEKDRKIRQLNKVFEEVQTLLESSKELIKAPNKSDRGSQAPIHNQNNSTNASNVDADLLKATMSESINKDRLVHELRCKLAKQEKESGTKLMELKTKMTARFKKALEEKENVVKQNLEEHAQLQKEHQIFERRNNDMARKALDDTAVIDSLTAQTKLLYSTKQQLLQEIRRLELRGDNYKAKLGIESKILDHVNSRVAKLTNEIYTRDNKLARMVRARDAKIKTLEKTVQEEEKIILTLRQWDAESGVTERDQLIKERDKKIQKYKKDKKEFLEHIENLEHELLKQHNVGLIEKISRWIFGTPPV
ncbi:hypothetical protein MMC31_001997 [Peltigera leucophlebia]|nr:hypothetical protein [Peltigera leucophlebia]